MPTKVGSIVSLGRTGAKFIEAYLDGGQKVELPHALWERLRATYTSGERLIFIERRGRLFRYVQWVGTAQEAREAVTEGVLTADEVPDEARDQAPELEPDWNEMAQRSILALVLSSREGDHEAVVEWLERLSVIATRAPFPDLFVHVQMFAVADDPKLKKQGVDGMMSWVRSSLATPDEQMSVRSGACQD